MIYRYWLIACTIAAAPSLASAALDLRIGPNKGAGEVDAAVAPGAGQQFFDLTFTETPPERNDQLYAYDLLLRTEPGGLRLVRIEKPDNWVLSNPDATFTQAEVDAAHVYANAVNGNGVLADITTGSKAARVFYTVDPGTAPGLYAITFDLPNTVFASGDPNCDCPILPDFSDVGLVRVTPEPSCAGVLCVGAVLALRRRARA